MFWCTVSEVSVHRWLTPLLWDRGGAEHRAGEVRGGGERPAHGSQEAKTELCSQGTKYNPETHLLQPHLPAFSAHPVTPARFPFS